MIIPFVKRLKKWAIDQRSMKNGISTDNSLTIKYPIKKSVGEVTDNDNVITDNYYNNIHYCNLNPQ